MTGPSVPAITPAAGSSASLVTTPQTGAPAKSAVEQASDAARAAIAERGTALGQPRVGAGHPAGGQFVQSTVKEVGANVPGDAPQAGLDAPAGQSAPDGQQPPPTGEQPPAGTEGEQATGEEETDEERAAREAEEASALRVLLPGREGDEEYEFVVESPEAAERLRQLKNGYLRGNEVRELSQRAETALAEAAELREAAEVDPVGFTIDAIGESPDAQEHLVLAILTQQPGMWDRLKPKLQKLVSDPNEYRIVAAETKAARAEFASTVQTEIAERRAVQENLRDVQAACAAMLPETMPPEQQRIVFHDMLRDIQQHATRYGLNTVPVHELPTLLARRLTAYGIDPVQAAQKAAQAGTRQNAGGRGRTPAPRPGAPNASPGAPPAAAPRAPAPKTGKSFTASATRKAQAAIPSGGAGSPGTGGELAPPRKADGSVMSTEETIAWHRARLAKGQRALVPSRP